MTTLIRTETFEILHCANCGMAFAFAQLARHTAHALSHGQLP